MNLRRVVGLWLTDANHIRGYSPKDNICASRQLRCQQQSRPKRTAFARHSGRQHQGKDLVEKANMSRVMRDFIQSTLPGFPMMPEASDRTLRAPPPVDRERARAACAPMGALSTVV